MKLSALLHIRLLYSVVIVLTICLLIVGGAYRMKAIEVSIMQEDLNRVAVEADAQFRSSQNALSEMASKRGEPFLGGPIDVAVRMPNPAHWRADWALQQSYIRYLEARLKAYEDASPQPCYGTGPNGKPTRRPEGL